MILIGQYDSPFVRRVGIALTLAGCLSPTLPLPPPSQPAVTDHGDGTVGLQGYVQPHSTVFALNTATNEVAGQLTESGQYSFTIHAVKNDQISLWYEAGTDVSPTIEFPIR